MKKFILGLFVGVGVTASGSVFADDIISKVDAFINPSIPVTLDGKALQLDKPVAIIDGSSYLPLKTLGSAIGKEVSWNDNTKSIELKSTVTPANEAPSKDINQGAIQTTPATDDKYAGKIFISGVDLGQVFSSQERSIIPLVDKSEKKNDTIVGYNETVKLNGMFYSIDFLVGIGVGQDELTTLPKYKVVNGKVEPLK